jgi:CubicO group peptidase (beta-lactamase class C family)
MKLFRRLVIVIILAGAGFAQDTAARMEELVQSYVTAKQFMGSVLVSQQGKILLSKGYGSANLEWEIPNSPTTKFRLGSITKQFTAASILLLEERGKLKVEDPVKKYMADAPAAWDKITIFHLLTHTSGIPRSTFASSADYRANQVLPTTPENLVAHFRDRPLEFQPGEKWNYSNAGYVLLGYLIEKISGQSYSEFVQQNIFNPLGMKDSGYGSNSAIIAHRGAGYTPTANGPVNAELVDMTIPFSSGALYSTTEDLLKWEQGLFGGKVLSKASLTKMTTPFKQDYAFGLEISANYGYKVIEHDGAVEGFNTELAYYPDDKLVIAVLGNLNGPFPYEIAWKLADIVHGVKIVPASERKEITLPSKVLSNYVGTYDYPVPGFSMAITLEQDHLMTQVTGQKKFPLFAEAETQFFFKLVDAQVEFFKNAQGQVTHLVLHQDGRDVKCLKK